MSYILKVLPSLLEGTKATLHVFCIVIILSIPLGAILAFLMQVKFKNLQKRTSVNTGVGKNSSILVKLLMNCYRWILRGIPFLLQSLITLYIWVMRGTPLLLQLIFFYYVLPSVGVRIDRLPAAILAFTLNYGAYFAEIFRGGVQAIPNGQYEAAKVLKLNQLQTIRYIILPQVFKIVLPSMFNEIINLVKDSSLVYVIGVSDLLLASKTAANRDATLAPMFVAGAIYLLLIGLVTIISKQTEKKFNYYE